MPIVVSDAHQGWVKVPPPKRKTASRRNQDPMGFLRGPLGYITGQNLEGKLKESAPKLPAAPYIRELVLPPEARLLEGLPLGNSRRSTRAMSTPIIKDVSDMFEPVIETVPEPVVEADSTPPPPPPAPTTKVDVVEEPPVKHETPTPSLCSASTVSSSSHSRRKHRRHKSRPPPPRSEYTESCCDTCCDHEEPAASPPPRPSRSEHRSRHESNRETRHETRHRSPSRARSYHREAPTSASSWQLAPRATMEVSEDPVHRQARRMRSTVAYDHIPEGIHHVYDRRADRFGYQVPEPEVIYKSSRSKPDRYAYGHTQGPTYPRNVDDYDSRYEPELVHGHGRIYEIDTHEQDLEREYYPSARPAGMRVRTEPAFHTRSHASPHAPVSGSNSPFYAADTFVYRSQPPQPRASIPVRSVSPPSPPGAYPSTYQRVTHPAPEMLSRHRHSVHRDRPDGDSGYRGGRTDQRYEEDSVPLERARTAATAASGRKAMTYSWYSATRALDL